MTLDVRPFGDEFVEAAARLLSGNAATRPAGEYAPAPAFVDETVAREGIVGSQATGPAVVAVRDGELVGFLMSTALGASDSRQAEMSEAQHAADRSAPREIYRALYTALSGDLVDNRCFAHSIALPIAETDAVSVWFELGFGVDQIKGLRSVSSVDLTVNNDRGVRAAEPRDIEALVALSVELQELHAAPPVFNLARLDLETSRQSFERAIADERCGVLVAEEGDRIIGMMQVEPATRYRTVATIGIAIATEDARSQGLGSEILAHVVEWAREQGYEYCAAGWTSANRISDAFWRSRGFQPTRYKLARRFDIARPR